MRHLINSYRLPFVGAIALTLLTAFNTAHAFQEKTTGDLHAQVTTSHDGKLVSMNGNTLVITTLQSKQEYSCTIGKNAKITCDSKVCKSSDLKPGMRIRVTPGNLDPNANGQIEALDKNQNFSGTN